MTFDNATAPTEVSDSPAKPSRQSRAYLHLTKPEYIALLSQHIRNIQFDDVKGNFKDSTTSGPPTVEFAPYGRVPHSRPRKDARQGTIDQDPEFIDFLESLTNPIAKSASVDQENETVAKSKEKVNVTPLVQYLKDKKANKGKENSVTAKAAKHARPDSNKDVKAPSVIGNKAASSTPSTPSPKKRSAQADKVEQAARDAVKVLNRQAASVSKGAAAPAVASTVDHAAKPLAVASNSTANAALADKKRERGNASAAAKILQRDLGLGSNTSGRGGRGGRRGGLSNATSTASVDPSTTARSDAAVPQVPNTLATPSNATSATPAAGATVPNPAVVNKEASQPPTGPAASRPIARGAANNAAASSTKHGSSPSTATQAFLKHANPSQGITEPLLEEAFSGFGKINKVEIDKKKGFAYVDFVEPESLQKAIKVSPIKVAQGQVVVLERKSGPNLQARNLRGGAMIGSRGGGMPIGGRGGSIRGRGGFVRGGINMPNGNSRPTQAMVNTPNKQASIIGDAPSAGPTSKEGSATAAPASTATAG